MADIAWHEFQVASTGTSAAMVVEDSPWATVRLTDDVEIQSELLDPDEVQHSMLWHGLELVVRHTMSQWWTIRWLLHNPTNQPIAVPDLCVRFEVGPTTCGWAWASGVDGAVIAAPVNAPGPVVAWNVTLGVLRRSGKKLIVTPPGLVLQPGQRYISSWRGKRFADVSAARAALPKWLPDQDLPVGEPLVLRKGQVSVGPKLSLRPVMADGQQVGVEVLGPAGEHQIEVVTGRGVNLLKPAWAPDLDQVIAVASRVLLAEDRVPTGAEGVVLLAGLARHLIAEPELARQRVAQIWAAQGVQEWGQLDLAFAAQQGLAAGDSVVIGEAIRRGAELSVGLGYGQVAARLWLAAVSVGLGESAEELLRRRSGTVPGLTELSLLVQGDTDKNRDLLAGAINRLGADVPGQPWALGRVRRAKIVGVLRSCPDSSPLAPLASATATKTVRRLLAMISGGGWPSKDVETLAWLVLADSY